jgi:hypothetical protein
VLTVKHIDTHTNVNENESLPGGDKGDINHKGDIREI